MEGRIRRGRVWAVALLIASGLMLALAIANARMDLPLGPLDAFFEKWSYNVVLVGGALVCLLRAYLAPAAYRVWLVMGASMAVWTAGNVYYTIAFWDAEIIPTPSLADLFWLLFYVGAFYAVFGLMKERASGTQVVILLDGLVGALAVGALAAAIVIDPVLEAAVGGWAEVATNLAYPVADVTLMALIVAVAGTRGWRVEGSWTLLMASLALFAIVDSIYLVQVAEGSWVPGNFLEAGWPAAMLLMGFAAWRNLEPSSPKAEREGWRVLVVPFLFACLALAVLVWDHFARVNVAVLILASTSVAVALVRMTLTFAENLRMLRTSREEALSDSLTGLGNRRRLLAELEQLFEEGGEGTLVIFDLDGFKSYNDSFGHPAGDSLLVRLGARLKRNLPEAAIAYRLGGDEFCVLLPTSDSKMVEAQAAQLAAFLGESGEGFSVGASYGWSLIPTEVTSPSDAFRTADRRMYEMKSGGRISAGRQSTDVLLQVLQERDPDLESHLKGVAVLARAVCKRLGVSDEDTRQIELAAELHDIGKVAIPEAILNKPERLTDNEREYIQKHTVVGQRILSAAPALVQVARLVRSSHERMDGTGYPDRLAAEDIPLGSRIVAVCDAFDAMTTDRPYRRAVSVASALRELDRCAGTQFDPAVVTAFAAVVQNRATEDLDLKV